MGLCGLDSVAQGLWVSLAGSSPGTLRGCSYEHMEAAPHSEKDCGAAEPPAPATPAGPTLSADPAGPAPLSSSFPRSLELGATWGLKAEVEPSLLPRVTQQ